MFSLKMPILVSNSNNTSSVARVEDPGFIVNQTDSEEDDDGADMNPFKFAALNKKLGMMNFLLNKKQMELRHFH